MGNKYSPPAVQPLGFKSHEHATSLAEGLRGLAGIDAVEIAGPEFINISLRAAAAGELAKAIVESGASCGNGDLVRGVALNL